VDQTNVDIYPAEEVLRFLDQALRAFFAL